MPQTIVEYSNNLIEKGAIDPNALAVDVNKTLAALQTFGDADLKCIVRGSDLYARSSAQPENKAFLWVVVNILGGRPLELRQQISKDIIAMLKTKIKLVDGLEIQISVDVNEMNKDTYIKEILN